MSFFAPYEWAKNEQQNKQTSKLINAEFDKIVQQAKRAIGNEITLKEIKNENLTEIHATITLIDKHLKRSETQKLILISQKQKLILTFLKAQLCHKVGRIALAIENYNTVITVNTFKLLLDKKILAESYIAIANTINQKAIAAEETKIKEEEHGTRNDKFIKYILQAIKFLPDRDQIKYIMNQYQWPYKKQLQHAEQLLTDLQKSNYNSSSILKMGHI